MENENKPREDVVIQDGLKIPSPHGNVWIDCGSRGHYSKDQVAFAADVLTRVCFGLAQKSGWWTDLETGEPINRQYGEENKPLKFNVPEKLMLIVSEVAEGMEGFRKNLKDDKLPNRSMLEVELADALIRIFDLAGGLRLDLASAVAEKLQFNALREDHKIENRKGENGKKF
jgi:NTP pyrophosphatase (non-canonical NTP hydrolase)